MNDYTKLREVVAYNEKQMDKVDGDQCSAENLATFYNGDAEIWNPFYESSCRFEVDPIKEYGEENIQKMINEYDKMMANKEG